MRMAQGRYTVRYQEGDTHMHQAPNYFLGIDLDGTHIKSALLDINLNVITERSDPTNVSIGPDHVCSTVIHPEYED
jgi:activator of 2-hydroxyglutaryl-CoA dehydratase